MDKCERGFSFKGHFQIILMKKVIRCKLLLQEKFVMLIKGSNKINL